MKATCKRCRKSGLSTPELRYKYFESFDLWLCSECFYKLETIIESFTQSECKKAICDCNDACCKHHGIE